MHVLWWIMSYEYTNVLEFQLKDFHMKETELESLFLLAFSE